MIFFVVLNPIEILLNKKEATIEITLDESCNTDERVFLVQNNKNTNSFSFIHLFKRPLSNSQHEFQKRLAKKGRLMIERIRRTHELPHAA